MGLRSGKRPSQRRQISNRGLKEEGSSSRVWPAPFFVEEDYSAFPS
jgi:hypothetical protein